MLKLLHNLCEISRPRFGAESRQTSVQQLKHVRRFKISTFNFSPFTATNDCDSSNAKRFTVHCRQFVYFKHTQTSAWCFSLRLFQIKSSLKQKQSLRATNAPEICTIYMIQAQPSGLTFQLLSLQDMTGTFFLFKVLTFSWEKYQQSIK